jgi:hypothetical protein
MTAVLSKLLITELDVVQSWDPIEEDNNRSPPHDEEKRRAHLHPVMVPQFKGGDVGYGKQS